MNIFERAARRKLRFDTIRGAVTTEDLFDIPLRAKGVSAFSLDHIARSVSKMLKEETEDSFVDQTTSVVRTELELKLDILKYVIESKLADEAAAAKRVENAEKRRKILEALARKEDEEIGAKSKDDLLKELEALSA